MIALEEPVSTTSPPTPPDAQGTCGVWMETLSHLDPKYGGLTAVVPALSAQLQQRGCASVRLGAFCDPSETITTPANQLVETAIWPAGHARWLTDMSLERRFRQTLAQADGVHIHGLWDAGTRVTASLAQKLEKPYVVSAHGMLEPWALAQGAWKKRLYASLVERPNLQRAAWLHALTSAEAQDYRNFGCTGPIAIIPNAVEAPHAIDEAHIEDLFPRITGRRVVLFLGRLHVKKGIELLLEAWSALHLEESDFMLMLAGPGETAYVHSLQALATTLGIQEQVLFCGMLDAEAKWSALQRAHVFVLPSYSEGLSVATLEALSTGTPVIVTEACHLPEVVAEGCGWQVPTDSSALASALRSSLESTDMEQASRSRNARRLARTRYSWDTVCAQIAELYRCVLGGGTPSSFAYQERMR